MNDRNVIPFLPSFRSSLPFVSLSLRSFVPSFPRSLVQSFLRSIDASFLRSIVPSFNRSIVPSSPRSPVCIVALSFEPCLLASALPLNHPNNSEHVHDVVYFLFISTSSGHRRRCRKGCGRATERAEVGSYRMERPLRKLPSKEQTGLPRRKSCRGIPWLWCRWS